MIYLLHFKEPYKHAKHYLGMVSGGGDELIKRIERHKAGRGARLIEVITAAGISFEVARIWEGDRKEERRLKRMKMMPRLCPICRQKKKEKLC